MLPIKKIAEVEEISILFYLCYPWINSWGIEEISILLYLYYLWKFAKVEEREARLANYLESEERKLEAELAKIRQEKDDIDEKRRDFETWKSNFVSLFLILRQVFFRTIFFIEFLFKSVFLKIQTAQRSKSLQHMKKKGSHEFLDQWTEEDRPSKGSLVERWSRSQGKGPSSNLRGLLTLTRSKKTWFLFLTIIESFNSYRVTHNGWDYRDDCTEFWLPVFLHSWFTSTVDLSVSIPNHKISN